MTRTWMTGIWVAALAVGLSAAQVMAQPSTEPAQTTPTPESPLKTQMEKVSYTIGASIGKDMKQQGLDIDVALLAQGMKDALAGGKMLMTEEQMRATMGQFSAEMSQKQAAEMKKRAEENKAAGDAFMAANKTKPGVVTLPSGLQYKVLKAGTGKKPLATNSVEVNYRGTLINGTVFDQSDKGDGKPITLSLTRVIPGWKEALQRMSVGSKWQLVIPPQLAYGPQGTPGGPIGPNSTLIFEIELLAIKP
jgi:FKBP-type peptidyl-prolyl cis-trans isomerase FklB